MPEIVKYAPAGASTRQFLHYAQEITSGRFCRYDYGAAENVQLYGAEIPLAYEIDKITCPVAVYYANNDALVATQVRETLNNINCPQLSFFGFRMLIDSVMSYLT